jgi:hypothetical protein
MSIFAKSVAAAYFLTAFSLVSAQAPLTGCTRVKYQYHCDKVQLTELLKDAKFIAIESQPFNKVSETALEHLVRDLGKSVQADSPDLTFALAPADPDGIYIGPNDRELATLRVYSRSPQGHHGQLIWVETFIGQPDMQWLMVVRGTIQQFKSQFK